MLHVAQIVFAVFIGVQRRVVDLEFSGEGVFMPLNFVNFNLKDLEINGLESVAFEFGFNFRN